MRIDFTLSRDDDPKSSFTGPIQCSIFLDPARCWCIYRFRGTIKSKHKKGDLTAEREFETNYETVDHPSGFPLVKTSTTRSTSYNSRDKKKESSRTEIEYEWKVDDSIPDAEFTLTAFGLPEPGGEPPVKKPLPLYVWILASAGGCSALALGFWYLARRVRAKPAV